MTIGEINKHISNDNIRVMDIGMYKKRLRYIFKDGYIKEVSNRSYTYTYVLYENGKIMCKGPRNIKIGNTGEWKYYDVNGKLISTKYYDNNGKLIETKNMIDSL